MKKIMMVLFCLSAYAGRADFTCSVKVADGEVGSSRTVTATYTGGGSGSPLVRVEAGDGAYVRFSEADGWSKSVEFLALDGAGTQEFFCLADSKDAKLELSYTAGSSETIPWTTLGASLKPSYVSADAWTYAEKELESRLGATWNTYLARLKANADYLANLGYETKRTDRLLSMEINRALGVNAVMPTLASATDISRSARGLPLAFSRSFSSAMYAHFNCGILGYGWTDNYSVYAELVDATTLVIRLPSGESYSFSKVTGTWQPEDARDVTTLSETGDTYALTYENGMVQTFAKANMRLKSIADNVGNKLTFAWSGTKLQSVTHSDGQKLVFTYNTNGLLTSVVDDLGNEVSYAYNSNSMLTSVTALDGTVTRYSYISGTGLNGRSLSQIAYSDGTTLDLTYETTSSRITLQSVTPSSGGVTRFAYPEVGTVQITAADGGVTTVAMGPSSEVLKATDALGNVVTRTYDADGLLKSILAPSGKSGQYAYDARGRVTTQTSAAGNKTMFDYTELFGNLKTLKDAKNQSVTYGYDNKGRATSVTFPDGAKMLVAYNAKGDVAKTTNCRGQSETYGYDAEGRVTSRTWANGRTFTYAYDTKGRLITATDSESGKVTMTYDNADRLTKIAYPDSKGFTFIYDAAGRMTKRTSLDGTAECYVYDAAGRMSDVTDGNGNLYVRNTYDATTGRLTTQTYGNGASTSYRYDLCGRIESIVHNDASGGIAESIQYCYDADGYCFRTYSRLGSETYAYDYDGQITYVNHSSGENESFVYDAAGNRTTANGTSYTVNALNQYTKIGTATCSYDTDGNLIGKTENGSTTTYTYDQQNRLIAVKNTDKGIDWSCTYDVLGNRVSVTENGVTTKRVILPGALPSVAAEYRNGALVKRHIVVGATQIADIDASGASHYYHGDLIGSTRAITDATGATVNRISYKAFGEVRTITGDATTVGYVGTLGVETDPTGLLFMRNRYYDPQLGRFIQRDPIGLSGGDANWYRYCGNRPTSECDPFGLLSWRKVAVFATDFLEGFTMGAAKAALVVGACAAVGAAGAAAVGMAGAVGLVSEAVAIGALDLAFSGTSVAVSMWALHNGASGAGMLNKYVYKTLLGEHPMLSVSDAISITGDIIGMGPSAFGKVASGVMSISSTLISGTDADRTLKRLSSILPVTTACYVTVDEDKGTDSGGTGGGTIMDSDDWLEVVKSGGMSATYSLGADINIPLLKEYQLENFTGTINGNGHLLSGPTISNAVGATFINTTGIDVWTAKDCKFENCNDVEVTGEGAVGCEFTNCGAYGVNTLNSKCNKCHDMSFYSASNTTFSGCIDLSLGHSDEKCSFDDCQGEVGNAVGGTFSNSPYLTVKNATNGAKFSGAIGDLQIAESVSLLACSGKISDKISNSTISGAPESGESLYVHEAVKCTFTNCRQSNTVLVDLKAEDCDFVECEVSDNVMVRTAYNSRFTKCKGNVNINLPKKDGFGALLGSGRGCQFESCDITGTIVGEDSIGGLMGSLDGEDSVISNCTVDVAFTARDGIGGIAHSLVGGTVYSCSASGTATRTAGTSGTSDAAGLVNYAKNVNINGSVAKIADASANNQIAPQIAEMHSSSFTGGRYAYSSAIARTAYTSVITSCQTTVDISDATSNSALGGIIYAGEDCTLIECKSSGSIVGGGCAGGLFGKLQQSLNLISNCVSEAEVSGSGSYVGGLGGALFGGEIVGSVAKGLVTGASTDKCKYVGGLLGGASSSTVSDSFALGAVIGKDWIGGAIGYASECVVLDCAARGKVTGETYVGGFFGQSEKCTVTGCQSMSDVTGGYRVGGFVGDMNGGTVDNCSAKDGSVKENSEYSDKKSLIGGFAGEIRGTTCQVSGCAASASVSAGESTSVGGFAGDAGGSSRDASSFVIEGSYASGAVVGGNYVAGFAGKLSSCIVRDCYASGAVTSKGMQLTSGVQSVQSYAAGFAGSGSSLNNVTFQRCYASGKVTAPEADMLSFSMSYTGGLTPYIYQTETGDNCYWNKTTTGQSYSGVGTGITAGNKTSTFAGFDFSGTWAIGSSGLYLKELGETGKIAQVGEDDPTPETPPVQEEQLSFTVSFNANGGVVTESTRKIDDGSSVGALPTAKRTGYDFLGWFTAASGGVQVNASTVISSDVTFYAHWQEEKSEEPEEEPKEEQKEEPEPVNPPSEQDDRSEMVSALAAAAITYNAIVMDENAGLAGTLQVKTTKANKKTGVSKVTATYQPIGGKKVSFKGGVTTDGENVTLSGGGMSLVLDLMPTSASGQVNGLSIDGSTDKSKSKDASDVAVLAAFKGKAYAMAMKANGYVTASIVFAAKGKAKVTGTLPDGTKISISSQLIVGTDMCSLPVVYSKKSSLGFVLQFDRNGNYTGITGLTSWKTSSGDVALDSPVVSGVSNLTGTRYFNFESLPSALLGTAPVKKLLPVNVAITLNKSKWVVPKAAKVSLKNGVLTSGENPAAVKLTYTAKTGIFKGSCSLYTEVNGKLKKHSVTLNGIVVDGVGYGSAIIKKVGSYPIVIADAVEVEDDPAENDDGESAEDAQGAAIRLSDSLEAGTTLYTGFITDSSKKTGSPSWPLERGTLVMKLTSDGALIATIDSFFGCVNFYSSNAKYDVSSFRATLTGSSGETLEISAHESNPWYHLNIEGSVTGGIFGKASYDLLGSRDQFTGTLSSDEENGVKAFEAIAKGTYRVGISSVLTEADRKTDSGRYPYDWNIEQMEDGTLTFTIGENGMATLNGTLDGKSVSASTKILFWTAADYANAIFYIKDGSLETCVSLALYTDTGVLRMRGEGWRRQR